jgi:hypothetical protein
MDSAELRPTTIANVEKKGAHTIAQQKQYDNSGTLTTRH